MDFDHNPQDTGRSPNYQKYTSHPPSGQRSQTMTTAATILSIVAISTTCCIYISFICGILGIIFALLSKGGEMTMSSHAKTALYVSIFAICLTLVLTIGSFISVLMQYGSVEAFWEAYMELVEAYSSGTMPY